MENFTKKMAEIQIKKIQLLDNIPTKIERLRNLGGKMYIKRDDINNKVYGGNKIRKFEYIFPDILRKNKIGVVTFGDLSSNQGLVCGILTRVLGLRYELFLHEKDRSEKVNTYLSLFRHFGAKLHFSKTLKRSILKVLLFRLFHRKYYLLPIGSSLLFGLGTPLGSIGFVEAVSELKQQIESGEMPEPDVIFVGGCSMGTGAGLIVGCKLLGLKSKVHIVSSCPFFDKEKVVIKNCKKTITLLRKYDKTIPKIKDFDFILTKTKDLLYNWKDIIMRLEGESGINLDSKYVSRTLTKMLEYSLFNPDKTVLFWNTHNSNDINKLRENYENIIGKI